MNAGWMMAPWTKCKGTAIFSNLAEGMHTFEARAIDHAGNMDSSLARFVWTVKGITTAQGIKHILPIHFIMPTILRQNLHLQQNSTTH